MSQTTRPLIPADREDVAAVFSAMQRQLALLGWHVKQLQGNAATVNEEISGGMDQIEAAMRALRKL